MEIKIIDNIVKWEYNEKSVEIKIDNVIWSRFRKDKDMIFIKTGKNFIANAYYYYSLSGEPLMKYDLETGEVTWYHNGEHQLALPYTETVGFYPEHHLLLIIYRTAEERNAITAMKIFDLDGNLLYSFTSPEGYTMMYVTEIDEKYAKVVCDATIEENVDPYGRDRFNFTLDLQTGQWDKVGLAY